MPGPAACRRINKIHAGRGGGGRLSDMSLFQNIELKTQAPTGATCYVRRSVAQPQQLTEGLSRCHAETESFEMQRHSMSNLVTQGPRGAMVLALDCFSLCLGVACHARMDVRSVGGQIRFPVTVTVSTRSNQSQY